MMNKTYYRDRVNKNVVQFKRFLLGFSYYASFKYMSCQDDFI